jgi:hypothetical protein
VEKIKFLFYQLMLDTGNKAKAARLAQDHLTSNITPENDYKGPLHFIIPSTCSSTVNMMIKTVKYWYLIGSLNYVYRTGYDVAY